MRIRAVFAMTVFAVACGGAGSNSGAPSPAPLTGSATLSGSVVTTQTGAAIGGAQLSLATLSQNTQGQNASAATTTTADGRYAFPAVPLDVLTLSISRPGFVTRETLLSMTGSRSDVTIDAIADEPPFSLTFYRNFARNALDAPTRMRSIEHWTTAPSVYLQTSLPDGSPMPSQIVAAITRVMTNSVNELSGGRYHVATFETGADARAVQAGWITISVVSPGALGAHVLGNASLLSNTAVIRLVYDPALEARYQTDFILHCDAGIVEVADHEIVHAMGFYHTGGSTDFQSGVGCPGIGRSARATYHAAIAYARPRGNLDPDRDAAIPTSAASDAATISCLSPLTARIERDHSPFRPRH